MKKGNCIEDEFKFLECFAWEVFACLQVPFAIPQPRADRLVEEWLSSVRSNYSTADFEWVVRRKNGVRLEYLALMAGLRDQSRETVDQIKVDWQRISGEPAITLSICAEPEKSVRLVLDGHDTTSGDVCCNLVCPRAYTASEAQAGPAERDQQDSDEFRDDEKEKPLVTGATG